MLHNPIKRPLLAVTLTAALCLSAAAQDQRTKGSILERLQARYVPTQTTDDSSDIVTAGSILTLRKDNLMTVGLSSGSICPNTYRDGRITQSTLAKVTCGRAISVTGGARRRIFLSGQKLRVTAIDVKDSSVVFDLYTDAYAGERYKATLTFPLSKGALPSPGQVDALAGEVFKADPPPQAATAEAPPVLPAPQPAVEDQPLPPIEAPPPPPEDPKSIDLGMSTAQVVANFGKPERIVQLGSKQIYFFKNLKVTFVDDKVSDVQ